MGGSLGGTATSSFSAAGTTVSSGQKFYFTTASDSKTYYVRKYVVDNGYGGMWFYDASMDHNETANPKNPVIHYAQTLLNSALPTGTFNSVPDFLPEGGGNATLNWTSTNATVRFD